jgi:predicted RNA-binding protein with PUA-like domain
MKKAEAGEQQYWALCANPELYRIEDAVRNMEFDWWGSKRSKLKPGDRVIIWKCKGRHDQHRGVVALGEVLTAPKPRQDDPDNPYWLDPSEGTTVENRVKIRYERRSRLPRWYEPGAGDALSDLTVARGRGTVFHVTAEQWREIDRDAGERLVK